MEWEVIGAQKATGRDVKVIVEGDTAEAAAANALLLGVLPSRTRPLVPAQAGTTAPDRSRRSKRAVTTQRTGKLWKGAQLLASLLVIGGVVTAVASASSINEAQAEGITPDATPAFAIGVVVGVGGLFLFILARVGAWWFHG